MQFVRKIGMALAVAIALIVAALPLLWSASAYAQWGTGLNGGAGGCFLSPTPQVLQSNVAFLTNTCFTNVDGTADPFASGTADLVNGRLRLSARNSVVDVILADDIGLQGDFSHGSVEITALLHVHGMVDTDFLESSTNLAAWYNHLAANGNLDASLSFNGASGGGSIEGIVDWTTGQLTSSNLGNDRGSIIDDNTAVPALNAFDRKGTIDFVEKVIVRFRDPDDKYQMIARLSVNSATFADFCVPASPPVGCSSAMYPLFADLGNTASLTFQIPDGYKLVTASGLLLTGTPPADVPNPGVLALMPLLGLGLIRKRGIALWKRPARRWAVVSIGEIRGKGSRRSAWRRILAFRNSCLRCTRTV